ncbi:1,6-anhydro-N-acetylmuramyl-L-alanine amidase AmpD [Caedibacter taeniospiralis]|uniref:1,6-anhydro-N-acetylmuramyl-L-alanine amidase AmpD n=1 Tax=Caedibacter taeniospiralis TaxID=28907 RepID=UPI000C274CE4|nr:1,6-anhydro-N-acetylmuramyl-L-alanine amidase AmpD [Caedibacter taeniospiralis]
MNKLQLNSDGWLSGVQSMPSPNYNERPQNTEVNLLVIHCISLAEGEYDNTHVEELFLNKLDITLDKRFVGLENLTVSSHFYIKRAGDIIQFVSTEKRAWHAGISCYKGRENCNDFSIGIELQGTDKTHFKDAQYQSLSRLTDAIRRKYPDIENNITGHSEIAPQRKTDPGVGFDWQRFLASVK